MPAAGHNPTAGQVDPATLRARKPVTRLKIVVLPRWFGPDQADDLTGVDLNDDSFTPTALPKRMVTFKRESAVAEGRLGPSDSGAPASRQAVDHW